MSDKRPSEWLVTDADLRNWQYRKAKKLMDLLDRGAKAKLPPLVWTVATSGALLGRAELYAPTDPRTAFNAWANFLHADRRPEVVLGGTVRLHASTTPEGHPAPDIVVVAEFPVPDDEDGPADAPE